MRTLTYFGCFIGLIGLLIDLFQVFRWNLALGISDMAVLCFGSTVLSTIGFAISQLPSLVLFQKLAPPHVEATMMAFSASIVNLSRGMIGQLTGAFINKYFVGVTAKDLSNYYILVLIGFGNLLWELCIIRLIPVQKEIDAAVILRQSQREEIARENSMKSEVKTSSI